MTISNDKIRIEGNSLVIRMQPATGLLALTSFISTEVGVTGTAYFEKYFRYALNGIIFNDWQPLTLLAITNIIVSSTDDLLIELSYQKVDITEGESSLGVLSVVIEGTKDTSISQNFFDKTVFKEFFESDSIEILGWYLNVLDKLYQKGIVPNYIDRLNDFDSPDDFLEFWKSIAKFFSYYVIYARQFQKFYESESLLDEYVSERGLRTSIENTLSELNLLMTSFYQQIAHRGTNHIQDLVESGAAIDGELLRLIWYKPEDEFLFNLHKKEHFGWNLSNSSPLYRGLYLNDNANKYGDKSFEPQDISLYPTGGVIVEDESKQVLYTTSTLGSSDYKIKVSPELDYEFSFLIKKEAAATLTVRLEAYDKDLTLLDLVSHKDGSTKNNFFTTIGLSRDDKYLLIKLFLFNKDKKVFADDITNIHQGENLILVENVNWITPFITIEGGSAKIYGVRFMPLNTPYSHGLLQVNNWISCWLKNRNNSLQITSIENFIKKYLIPYNSHLSIVVIEEGVTSSGEEIVTTTTTTAATTTTTTTTI